MNYNSFLTKDYKSVLTSPQRRTARRWTRVHSLLLVVLLLVAGTILVFVSGDAATSKQAQAAPPASPGKTSTITLPLDFPALQQPAPAAATQPPSQTATPSAKAQTNWQTVKVKHGDSLAAIFKREGIAAADLHQIMRLGKISRPLKQLRPNQIFRFSRDPAERLQAMKYEINPLESLLVTRQPDQQFSARILQGHLENRFAYASGEISSSLFEAGKLAGMPDAQIMDLVAIFGWDIDFVQDIRRGDRFALLYEEQFLQGKKLGNGPIVAAEFTTQGHTYRAVRYTDATGHSDYYSPNGHSMRKAFLRTPVDFRRISSRFGRRYHPLLHKNRMHKGVDYAAKLGTPIKAAGDGKIIFRGRKGGYGRVIILQHGGHYSTLYAHMNGFKSGLRVGSRVKQGQIIGFVGSSGRSTGPHLHYEFRVNGTHRNPLTVRLPDAAPINKNYRQDFMLKANGLLSQLETHTPQVALFH